MMPGFDYSMINKIKYERITLKKDKGEQDKMKRNIKILLLITILFVTYVGCARKDTSVGGTYNEKTDTKVEAKDTEEKAGSLKRTVAILGVDEGMLRPDVIFVVRIDSESGQTDVISIPRDTKVVWGTSQQEAMKKSKGYTVSVSKINEMLVHGGKENMRALLLHEIEYILEMPIDNYVIIDLEAFTKIVDAVGGVEVEVPQRMYYVDRSQDLYIDLQPGVQVLDGKHAEMLVRFRRYPEGDVARVRTQHIFLKALADKVLSPQMITKIPQLVPILFESIETDIGFKEVMKYLSIVKVFDPSHISYSIVPGEGKYENGISYFFIDESEIEDFRSRLNPSQHEVGQE